MHTFHIIFAKTNTKVGRMIRLFTADDVNHCSIYFDGDKSTLYAFRREYRHKIFSGRFGVETLQQMSRDANMYYEEVSVEITDNQYRRMMRLIDFFKYKNYKYNYVGLVAFKLRINTLLKWGFVCSTFASFMMSQVYALDRPYYKYTPIMLRNELRKSGLQKCSYRP